MLILIVEDDQGIAFLLAESIEAKGREVHLAHSGESAMEFIVKQQPDLLILDFSLPDMNATGLIARLNEKGISVPRFIVSTGRGDETIAVEMMKMGAYDYLVKDAGLISRMPGVVSRALADINRERELNEAIEARKLSDQKLIEEQSRLANIIMATNAGTWEWDLKTNKAIFNERWAQMLGYTLSELEPTTYKTWERTIHPEDQQIISRQLEDHFARKTDNFEVEVRVKHKNGNWIWVQSRGCVLNYDKQEKPALMAGTMIDITHQKQKEQLEKEYQVAKEALSFKQNFLASMSHEIRTPLTGILGMIELMKKTALDHTQQDYMITLKNASENLREIIDQVLDYSDIEAGKLKIKPAKVELSCFIVKARELFEKVCNKPIEFEASVDPQLPVEVITDFKRIMQIINTLVTNAIRYSEKGKISLSLKRDMASDDHKLKIKVEVKDQGMGIHPDKHDQIFSPFSDVHHIDTSYYEGTGLGLALCKELVNMQGGEIGVDSQPDEGSTFWFTFTAKYPVNNVKETIPNDDQQEIWSGRELRVLVVEDKLITQKVVKLQLNELGFEVDLAINGKVALEKFSPEAYDLVLMDIQMPVMDGITAMKEIKKNFPGYRPVIGFSANSFEGDREKYMSMGFDEFLNKPMHVKSFLKVVREFFKQDLQSQ